MSVVRSLRRKPSSPVSRKRNVASSGSWFIVWNDRAAMASASPRMRKAAASASEISLAAFVSASVRMAAARLSPTAWISLTRTSRSLDMRSKTSLVTLSGRPSFLMPRKAISIP